MTTTSIGYDDVIYYDGSIGTITIEEAQILFLVIGDDYLNRDSQAFSWSQQDVWPPDLTGAAVEFQLWVPRETTPVYTRAGTVITPTGIQTVMVEFPRAWTALLSPGQYTYSIIVTLTNGDVVSLIIDLDGSGTRGTCIVVRS